MTLERIWLGADHSILHTSYQHLALTFQPRFRPGLPTSNSTYSTYSFQFSYHHAHCFHSRRSPPPCHPAAGCAREVVAQGSERSDTWFAYGLWKVSTQYSTRADPTSQPIFSNPVRPLYIFRLKPFVVPAGHMQDGAGIRPLDADRD